MELLGIKLKNLREQFHYSQEQIAEMVWTNRSTIALIESGKRKLKANELKDFATVFETTTDELLEPMKLPTLKVPIEAKREFEKILLYMLTKCSWFPNVGKTVIYKLMYFIEFNYYELYKTPLTWYPFIRLPLGPAPYKFNDITDAMEREWKITKIVTPYYGKYQSRIISNVRVEDHEISPDAKKVIDDVLKKLAHKTASELSEISHGDIPRQRVKDMAQIPLSLVVERTPEYSVLARQKATEDSNAMIAQNKSFAFLDNEEDLYENY